MEELEAILLTEDQEELDLFYSDFYTTIMEDRRLYMFETRSLEIVESMEEALYDVREGDRIFEDGILYFTEFEQLLESMSFNNEDYDNSMLMMYTIYVIISE